VIYLANPFMTGMSNYLGPKSAHIFTREGHQEVYRQVVKDTLFFLVVMGPFCALMLLFGGEVLRLMYGAKYADHGLLVGVLSLCQLTLALTIPTNSALSAIERPDVGLKCSLLALGCMLTLGLWLVKEMGPLGAALGLLAGNVVISTYRWVVFRRICLRAAAGGARYGEPIPPEIRYPE
jgi:O-antigen/teichoic acid export membrane protein